MRQDVAAVGTGTIVKVTRRAADRLRAGHLWVYRSDVERLPSRLEPDEPEPGGLVTVVDGRGLALGSGLYSAASEIAVRMVSARAGLTRSEYLAELADRLRAALALRAELAAVTEQNNAHRLVFAEADGLPGIVADRYNDLAVLQLVTQGTARADVRAVCAEVFREVPGLHTMVERPDARTRELEQLAPAPAGPLLGEGGSVETVFTMNGLRFGFDAAAGQKTGAFLDQRLNYAAAACHALGRANHRALDVCTYQGGFALHLARVCERVTGVDASRAALEVADANLERNREQYPELPGRVDWIEADAFDLLRAYEAAGERFGTVVLDPPAFAKSRRAVEGALRGYKEMNLRAIKMLDAGGTLVTCSCSHHVGLGEFLEVIRAAAADAHRRVQVLETRGAAPDHPAVVTLPETSYLKCAICRVG